MSTRTPEGNQCVRSSPQIGSAAAEMQFFMIVSDSEIAKFVSANGVHRLFVDLEYLGKDLRQKNLDTWKSKQTLDDVSRIRAAVPDAHLLVRINPLHEHTATEVREVLARGANSVMLPMFRTPDDIAYFLDLLAGRAEAVPLVETRDALQNLPRIVETLPLQRLHIGLNDLHLDLKMTFMFQPLAEGLLEESAAAMRQYSVKFGIGGLARAGEGMISPEYLLGEHVRLGSDAAILSRTFHRKSQTIAELRRNIDFPREITLLQEIYQDYRRKPYVELQNNRNELIQRIQKICIESMQRKEKGHEL
ncbi:aldolase [Pigmentiphaga sp. H8]|uniref:aldolase/citrate lyase family protein n=1 Tax=Pigmentiphaga sp. H8 TaxID=2488560 RepID=UPI000F597ABD|nr:aldolase/citrate lyase family protein [Pigmentiphaga sp. H8]AZG07270.1 aldolase [Pigmentiphaga sp. H8]